MVIDGSGRGDTGPPSTGSACHHSTFSSGAAAIIAVPITFVCGLHSLRAPRPSSSGSSRCPKGGPMGGIKGGPDGGSKSDPRGGKTTKVVATTTPSSLLPPVLRSHHHRAPALRRNHRPKPGSAQRGEIELIRVEGGPRTQRCTSERSFFMSWSAIMAFK